MHSQSGKCAQYAQPAHQTSTSQSGIRQSTSNLCSIPKDLATNRPDSTVHSPMPHMTPQGDTMSQSTLSVDEMMDVDDWKRFQSRGSGDARGSLVHRGSYEDANEAGQLKGEILDNDSDRGDMFVVNRDHMDSPPLSNNESDEANQLDNTDEEPEETIHQLRSFAPVSDVKQDIEEDTEEDIEEDIEKEGKLRTRMRMRIMMRTRIRLLASPVVSTAAAVSEHEHSALTPDPTMPSFTRPPKRQHHKVFQTGQKSVGLPTGERGPLDNASGMLQASDDLHVVSQLPSPVSVVSNVISNSDVYYFLCQQGGDLVNCDRPNCSRAVCLHCIPDLRQWNMTEQMRFECPACTTKRGGGAMQKLMSESYQGLYSVQSAEKPRVPLTKDLRILGKPEISQTARLDTSSLILVHLHLHSLPEYGTIANLVEEYLRAYYVDCREFLNWLDVVFDLEGSEATEGHRLHMLDIVSKI
ncbi:hypothetical protein BKA93DRAFT_750687 [Sparassis latifolia]